MPPRWHQASLIPSQARPSIWPYRVSYRTDVTFALCCSPLPFSRTQLQFTTIRSANRLGEDFHLLDMAPSRAHGGALCAARKGAGSRLHFSQLVHLLFSHLPLLVLCDCGQTGSSIFKVAFDVLRLWDFRLRYYGG